MIPPPSCAATSRRPRRNSCKRPHSRPRRRIADPPAGRPKPAETPSKAAPRALLKQGRPLLEKKKYEEADRACTQARAGTAGWGLFEDPPDKLRRDIQRARQSWERDESVRLMVEARKPLAQGEIDNSEKNTYN